MSAPTATLQGNQSQGAGRIAIPGRRILNFISAEGRHEAEGDRRVSHRLSRQDNDASRRELPAIGYCCATSSGRSHTLRSPSTSRLQQTTWFLNQQIEGTVCRLMILSSHSVALKVAHGV